MTYQAPVDELRFTLEEVAAVGAVKSGGAFAEFSEDLTFAILEEAAKLAGGVLAPLNRSGDLEGCTLKDGVVTTPRASRTPTPSLSKVAGRGCNSRPRSAAWGCRARWAWPCWK